MIRIRTDLVLLLMLNGNDYLPKLRGSSGFNRLFHTYLKLQREWQQQQTSKEPTSCCCMVDPDTLEFQLDFAIEYFGRLANAAPRNLLFRSRSKSSPSDNTTPLQQLNNLVEMSFVPQPLEFRVVWDNEEQQRILNADDDDEGEDDEEDDNDESNDMKVGGSNQEVGKDDADNADVADDESDENRVLVRLFLGEPGTEDFYSCDLWHPRGVSLKKARQKLAAMALADLAEDEQNVEDNENEDEDDDDDEDVEGLGSPNAGYEWDIRHPLEGKVDTYLYGLLWNLQTYQDGVCSDYGYNYGKHLAPTARAIVEFLQEAKRENRKVGPRELRKVSFTPPVSAAVSCLAALPSPVKYLVPEPYRSIPDERVDTLYGECMNPNDNVFDMKRFEELCDDEVRAMMAVADVTGGANSTPQVKRETPLSNENGRRILVSDHSWTVVSKVPKPLLHPFDPPEPFSDRLSKLRPNSRIRLSRLMALAKPRPRSVWGDEDSPLEIQNSDPGPFLTKLKTVDKVDYRVAYLKNKKRVIKGLRKAQVKAIVQVKEPSPADVKGATNVSTIEPNGQIVFDMESRMKDFNIKPPPLSPITNKDGETAMVILKQLSDRKIIGTIQVRLETLSFISYPVFIPKMQLTLDSNTLISFFEQWETFAPSHSTYASFDPKRHELIRLTVGKGLNPKTAALHEDLVYEQDRSSNDESRRCLQHHLASFALCDITGPAIRWSDVSYQELKAFLADTKVEG